MLFRAWPVAWFAAIAFVAGVVAGIALRSDRVYTQPDREIFEHAAEVDACAHVGAFIAHPDAGSPPGTPDYARVTGCDDVNQGWTWIGQTRNTMRHDLGTNPPPTIWVDETAHAFPASP